jgi:hypothetical protein
VADHRGVDGGDRTDVSAIYGGSIAVVTFDLDAGRHLILEWLAARTAAIGDIVTRWCPESEVRTACSNLFTNFDWRDTAP